LIVLMISTPAANVPAKITPMAVSSRSAARRLTQPMPSAVSSAAITAPG
jgi:hypothetical protein